MSKQDKNSFMKVPIWHNFKPGWNWQQRQNLLSRVCVCVGLWSFKDNVHMSLFYILRAVFCTARQTCASTWAPERRAQPRDVRAASSSSSPSATAGFIHGKEELSKFPREGNSFSVSENTPWRVLAGGPSRVAGMEWHLLAGSFEKPRWRTVLRSGSVSPFCSARAPVFWRKSEVSLGAWTWLVRTVTRGRLSLSSAIVQYLHKSHAEKSQSARDGAGKLDPAPGKSFSQSRPSAWTCWKPQEASSRV